MIKEEQEVLEKSKFEFYKKSSDKSEMIKDAEYENLERSDVGEACCNIHVYDKQGEYYKLKLKDGRYGWKKQESQMTFLSLESFVQKFGSCEIRKSAWNQKVYLSPSFKSKTIIQKYEPEMYLHFEAYNKKEYKMVENVLWVKGTVYHFVDRDEERNQERYEAAKKKYMGWFPFYHKDGIKKCTLSE